MNQMIKHCLQNFGLFTHSRFFMALRCLGLVLLFVLPPANFEKAPTLGLSLKISFEASLWAQTPPDQPKPQPYSPNEFAPFWHQLRRFEVVLIGSIPISLLLGSLVYDIVFTIAQPNVKEFTVATSEQDILQKIGISISISGLLAVLDMAIHLGHQNRERKERERIRRESQFLQRVQPPNEKQPPDLRIGPE